MRRAMAIQLIINREWGLAKNENPNQGAFIIDELTDLVEEAVLKEFEAIASRGGVLGAMETGYQRGKIRKNRSTTSTSKHDGTYPIIGVNTFLNPHGSGVAAEIELARSTDEENGHQLTRLQDFHTRNEKEAPVWQENLRQAVIANANVFEVMMGRWHCSQDRFPVPCTKWAGQYRRGM